jgi:hypothetical protein
MASEALQSGAVAVLSSFVAKSGVMRKVSM